MKSNPSFILDYLESCAQDELSNFMNELPSFYFDYSEISAYSSFLNIFFTRKRDKGGFIDYNRQLVFLWLMKDFKSLYNSLIWEADCISFAQGILEELVKDIKKLRRVDEMDHSDESRGKMYQNTSEGSLNSSQILNMNQSNLGSSMSTPQRRGSIKNHKRPLSIHSLKITTGTENGQIMKSYRESSEKYIKDNIMHQPYANTIYTAEQMTGYLKALFQQVSCV
jgi:hypothetical protein